MATKQRILRADRKALDCDEFTLSGRSCWITVDNLVERRPRLAS